MDDAQLAKFVETVTKTGQCWVSEDVADELCKATLQDGSKLCSLNSIKVYVASSLPPNTVVTGDWPGECWPLEKNFLN